MNQNIAIDGPAGAGKSTIAKRVAAALGSVYVDTGAMYRALAVYFLRKGFSGEDKEKIIASLPGADVAIRYEEGMQKVLLNGEDVTGSLREEAVGNMASVSSAIPEVRAHLLELQRSLAKKTNVVMDGRDIGTIVLPDAQTKIFLTASVAVRAKRRFDELTAKGETPDLAVIEKDIAERDERDMNRETAPLRQAEDAVLVDSSDLSREEVTEAILRAFYEKNGILIAKTAGFCFGVRRAVNMVNECVAKAERPVYTLGPIIHNELVVKSFEDAGVITLKDESELSEVKGGTVVVRSHGVTKEVEEEIRATGAELVDATCPFVAKIHEIVARESADGKQIVIIGDPQHPEVLGTIGWSASPCIVVSTKEDAESFSVPQNTRLCIVGQTTFHLEKFKEYVEIIKEKGYDGVVLNTICHATQSRQEEAKALAAQVDIMLVAGSRASSNTRKLYDICKERCNNTYYIQSPADLKSIHFQTDRCVGITAGASAPNTLIQEVSQYVRRAKL